MKKKFHDLTVICEGGMPDFTVEGKALPPSKNLLTPVLVEKNLFNGFARYIYRKSLCMFFLTAIRERHLTR